MSVYKACGMHKVDRIHTTAFDAHAHVQLKIDALLTTCICASSPHSKLGWSWIAWRMPTTTLTVETPVGHATAGAARLAIRVTGHMHAAMHCVHTLACATTFDNQLCHI